MLISDKADFVYIIFEIPGPHEEKLEGEITSLLGYLEGQEKIMLLPAQRKIEVREILDPLDNKYIFQALIAYAIASLTSDQLGLTGQKPNPSNLNTDDWKLNFAHLNTKQKIFKNVQVAWVITQQDPLSPLYDLLNSPIAKIIETKNENLAISNKAHNPKQIRPIVCDVCFAATSFEDGKRYSPAQFRQLTSNGFGIDEKRIEVMKERGKTKQEAIAEWKDLIAFSTTDWLLCPSCTAKAQSKEPQGVSTDKKKKWWQIWK